MPRFFVAAMLSTSLRNLRQQLFSVHFLLQLIEKLGSSCLDGLRRQLWRLRRLIMFANWGGYRLENEQADFPNGGSLLRLARREITLSGSHHRAERPEVTKIT
jgi:hypothetical protein